MARLSGTLPALNGSALTNLPVQTTDISGKLNLAGGTMTGSLAITTASTVDTVVLTRGTTSHNNMFKFKTGSSDKWIVGQRNDSTDHFRFYSYGTSSDVLSILTDGKVGIGTAAIDERLHVQGGDHERIQIESTVAGDAVIIHKNTANTWKVGATASIGGYGGDGKYSIADGNDIRFAISPTNGEITNPSGIYNTTPTSTTATGWNFNNGGATVTCVQNAAIKLGNCGASGFLLINDTTLNGQMAGLFTGGGRFDFVGYSGSWVNSSSPSTSQVGFYRSGSQIYVKNGQAGTVQLGLMTFRTRSGQ
jgi:hypothetical protein